MACSHFSVADRIARTQREAQQAAGDLRAAHGGLLQLAQAGAGRVLGAELIERDIGVIQNERQFVVEVLAGGQGQAAQSVEFVVYGSARSCGGNSFLHTTW